MVVPRELCLGVLYLRERTLLIKQSLHKMVACDQRCALRSRGIKTHLTVSFTANLQGDGADKLLGQLHLSSVPAWNRPEVAIASSAVLFWGEYLCFWVEIVIFDLCQEDPEGKPKWPD